MRKTIAILAAAHLAAGAAQAGDLRSSLAGRLVPAQHHAVGMIAAEPPMPERAGRTVVVQAPLPLPANPTAEAAASADAATTIPAPAQLAAPPAVAQAQPVPAPVPPVQATPAQPQNPAAPAMPQTPQAPAAPDAAIPAFTMSGEQLATIGVGVIGGLIILDSIGVPTAAAAFVGGLAGQWWYSVNQPSDDYVVARRAANRLWHDAAIRDGESMNRRWLRPVRDGRDG